MAHGRVKTAALPTKVCASCGREMQWRRKWASNWDEVRYCSDACRRRGVSEVDAQLTRSLRDLLAAQIRGGSVNPSDAARAVGGDGWHDLEEPARRAARRLVATGEAEIIQHGRVVDPSAARGPIQLRRSGSAARS